MKTNRTILVGTSSFALLFAATAQACDYHAYLGLPEPVGVWPTDPATAALRIQAADALSDAAISATVTSNAIASNTVVNGAVAPAAISAAAPAAIGAPLDSTVTGWMINSTNVKGRSTDTTINNAVSAINANVQQVRYTSSNTYIQVTSIPDYNIGPFNGNPNIPANANATFEIPRTPTATSTHTATGLGAIGVLVNGVEFFNISDSMSYQNAGVWHNNAGYVESPSFDAAKGHPQQQGVYHNHLTPTSLIAELGGSAATSVLLGYAIDGLPLYSDYAATTPGGPLTKMTSSYQLKTYANNIRGSGGPNVAGQYADGYFEEDYQYVAGAGTLDQYNSAFVYTNEYPSGTWAYFATTDASGNAAYPYLVGPTYRDVPDSSDTAGHTIIVPADSTIYTAPEPASLSLLAVAATPMIRRRRR